MDNMQQTVFLYVPCQMDLFQAETVTSAITVLNRLDQFCHYDKENTCCGRRFFMEGEMQYAKDLGYQVKKGEHAKAQFTIWKFYGKKDEEPGEIKDGTCHPKKAFWFTFDQVEKVS